MEDDEILKKIEPDCETYTIPFICLPLQLLLLSNDTVAQAQRLNPKDLRERICLSQTPF